MYIALKNDYPSFQSPPDKGGLLTPWAERGVLMINACLTVRAHDANSHANRGWERFTQKVIDAVARVRTHGVVFLAWGAAAGKRVAHIQQNKHCVLKSVHPSPLSAHRGYVSSDLFSCSTSLGPVNYRSGRLRFLANDIAVQLTCGHFKKANEWLEGRYGPDGVIDWNLIPAAATKSPEPKDSEGNISTSDGDVGSSVAETQVTDTRELSETNDDENRETIDFQTLN